jgi:lipid II:glycine glycyltransferase (peptidoglycan interpeptide bridge formation enzyme)
MSDVRFALRRALDPATAAAVDALVATAPNGHFTQHPGWPDGDDRGGKIVHLIGEAGGAVKLAAAVRLRATPVGLMLADVFRGPTAADAPLLVDGLRALEQLLPRRRLLALRVDPYWRGDGSVELRRALAALGYRAMAAPPWHTRTLTVPLDDDAETLLRRFRPATRRQIYKALRLPLEVREDLDDDGVARLHVLYAAMAARKSASPRSLAYLRATRDLFRAWPQRGFFLSSWRDGELLAAIAVFTLGRRAIYALGASSAVAPELPKAHLLHYLSMLRARARGCTSYDFGGFSDVAAGTEPRTATQKVNQFKSGFGGTPVELVAGHERVLLPTAYRIARALSHFRRRLRARVQETRRS